MKLTEDGKLATSKELTDIKDRIPALTRFNLEIAGSMIDVNGLTGRGWNDQIRVEDGSEYHLQGSVHTELIASVEDTEYHVVVSTSSSMKLADNANGVSFLSKEELKRAHEGDLPRLAYLRWIHVLAVNEQRLGAVGMVDGLPDELLMRIESDVRAAVMRPSRMLLADLKFQTRDFEPVLPIEGCSDEEMLCIRLSSVIWSTRKWSSVSSASRLLAPFVRAFFSDVDLEGRRLVESLRNSKAVLALAQHVPYSGLNEVAAVLFSALCQCDDIEYSRDDAVAIGKLAIGLLRAGMPVCARVVIGEMLRVNNGAADVAVEVLWEVQRRIKALPKEVATCEALQECLRSLTNIWPQPDEWRALDAVFDTYIKDIKDEDASDSIKVLAECVKSARDAHDAEIMEEDSQWEKGLPDSIKNPLVWQSLVYTFYGRPDIVLKAFPDCPTQTVEFSKYLPKIEVVWGIPQVELWRGLFPQAANRQSIAALYAKLYATALSFEDKHEPKYVSMHELGRLGKNMDARRLMFGNGKTTDELSMVAVESVKEDGSEASIMEILPFLSIEHKSFKENIEGAIWEYYPWANNAVGEVRISVDEGETRSFCAVMPYYVEDKEVVPRGQRYHGKICGFANCIAKSDAEKNLPDAITVDSGPLVEEHGGPVTLGFDPDFCDCFYQDTYESRMSRAGFSLCGRFVSKRIVKAYGNNIACVRIRCRRLAFDLDVYISADRVCDLKENDRVDVDGWLYVDFTRPVRSSVEYMDGYPYGAPLDCVRRDVFGGYACHINVDDAESVNWFSYAKTYLEQMEGVEEVSLCGRNEAALNFLVRQRGKVRKFAFILQFSDSPLSLKMQSVEMLQLTLTKKDQGFDLKWEIRNDMI